MLEDSRRTIVLQVVGDVDSSVRGRLEGELVEEGRRGRIGTRGGGRGGGEEGGGHYVCSAERAKVGREVSE